MKKSILFLILLLILPLSGCCEAQELPTQPAPAEETSCRDRDYILLVRVGQELRELSLEDYLAGVLLAEMPAEFSPEALKAQAIAARTFALRKAATARHTDCHVCSESSCCQGWLPIEGCDGQTARKLRRAVAETDGLVLTYGEQLIDATFFSCSGGRTEAAVAVWGGEVPYLQAVDSPGEEAAPVYEREQRWTAEELRQLLGDKLPEANTEGDPAGWFEDLRYSPGGGIYSLELGGVFLRGTELRRLLGLRSTRLTVEVTGEEICIRTYGYGHRVGLSQYGAEAMAKEGKSCGEILLYYYQGAQLQRLAQGE